MHPQELAIKIGSNEYIFSPISLSDAEKLSTACQFHGYNQAKQIGLSQGELNAVLRQCVEFTPSIEQLDNFSATPAGVIETVYLSLVKRQPTITRDQVRDILTLAKAQTDTIASIQLFLQKAGQPDSEGSEGN